MTDHQPADPETEAADLRRKLGEVTRLGESWAMETGTRREDGVALLAVLGDAALPVGAVLDRSTIDSEPSASDDTSRASASAHGKPRERAGAVAGEGSGGSDEEAAEPHMNLLETAWGVIANAGWDGMAQTPGWQEAAVRWRDDYHRWLDLHLRPGGYRSWEQLAGSLVRERDALFAEVAGARLESGRLKAKLLEYENAITWGTSCLNCSAVLDRANAERERAEAAEGKLAGLRSLAEGLRVLASNGRDLDANCTASAAYRAVAGDILAITGTGEGQDHG